MIRTLLGGLLCLSLSMAAEPNQLSEAESRQGWKLLFDGKSLKGWDVYKEGDWIVKDGALACQGTKPSWIGTQGTFSNYTLELEFRGSATVNSGVFLRSAKEGEPHVTGYELQIWDYQPAGFNTGSLVEYAKAPPVKIRADQWNHYQVLADGDHFVITFNGKTLLDTKNNRHSSGVIGFQCQKGNPIEFRNIKVRAK